MPETMRRHSAVYLAETEDLYRCTLPDIAALITTERLLKFSPFVLTAQAIKRAAEVECGDKAQGQTLGKLS